MRQLFMHVLGTDEANGEAETVLQRFWTRGMSQLPAKPARDGDVVDLARWKHEHDVDRR